MLVDAKYKDVFDHPERYRCGPNYSGTNRVFPVEVDGQILIFKTLRNPLSAAVSHRYIGLQDLFDLGERCSPEQALRGEAESLGQARGKHAPRLIAYDLFRNMLLREYIPGRTFRELLPEEQERVLRPALDHLVELESRQISIGNPHIKNTHLGDDGKVRWLDFEQKYTNVGPSKQGAHDRLVFVLSAYTVTRSEEMVKLAAELVADKYQPGLMRSMYKDMLAVIKPGCKLWFAYRLPIFTPLAHEVKEILEGRRRKARTAATFLSG